MMRRVNSSFTNFKAISNDVCMPFSWQNTRTFSSISCSYANGLKDMFTCGGNIRDNNG